MTKMKEFHFEDCSYETTLTDEMMAMIPWEAEELNLSACPLISSITNPVCDGHPNLKGIILRNMTRITNATFGRMDCVKYLHINFSRSKKSIIEHGAFKNFEHLQNLYLNGISKSDLPADILDGRFQVQVDGDVIPSASSHDVTTAKGTSVSGHAQCGFTTKGFKWLEIRTERTPTIIYFSVKAPKTYFL